jgi:3-carboxy-cis,cis-muconate cycloisomerase
MPHKQNPVLSVQIRRAALTAPGLGASLHVAAAAQVDQRADGGWHAEWGALRTLARQTVVAARQATELIDNLVVHADRIGWTARNAVDDLLAEQRSIRKLRGQAGEPTDPDGYLGATDRLIDAAVRRANLFLEQAER